jgi:hypothetical protein
MINFIFQISFEITDVFTFIERPLSLILTIAGLIALFKKMPSVGLL